MVKRRNTLGSLIRYLDDFLFGGKQGSDHCKLMMIAFEKAMADLGVPVAGEKTEGPKTVIVFLGLELDSVQMVVRIPMSKVTELGG